MNGNLIRLGVAAFGVLVIAGGASLAGDVPRGAPCKDRQARLLERFGDQGIDSDKDGTLTRAEIRTFLAQQDGAGGKAWGHRACARGSDEVHGPGMGRHARGMSFRGSRHGGPGLCDGSCWRHLEALDADSPPEHFTIERFPDADSDGDGVLNDAEWLSFAEKRRSDILSHLVQRFPNADSDGDGTLSDEELAALKERQLERRRARFAERHPDADIDGELSTEEMDRFRDQRHARRQARWLARHPEADTDTDGELSPEERDAFRQDRRTRMIECHPEADTNGDGVLSDDEAAGIREKAGPSGPRGPRH